ncbi:tyrosine-type recombinase/integrase [Micromonospora sp. H61]|nr:tyrosine-type recombinase/integrase [Micromonospora sp. H61]
MPLTVDQVRALAAAMPAGNRAMVIVQAGLGLRLGELLALRVQDVDHVGRTVRIEWQFAPQSKLRTEPKTRRSRRTIPLPQWWRPPSASTRRSSRRLPTAPCSPPASPAPTDTTTTARGFSRRPSSGPRYPRAPRVTTCGTTTRRSR